MATTTNYGWTTPDDTALVKDGASAIRTLGSSVDTTTKNLNPETTLGDIAYRSSTANVKTRLGLGTAGQVLTVNSGANAPEWAAISAGGMTLLSTTTLSGASTTISSISGSYTDLQIVGVGIDTSANADLEVRLNGNTGSNYVHQYFRAANSTLTAADASGTSMLFGTAGSAASYADATNFVINIPRYSQTEFHPIYSVCRSYASGYLFYHMAGAFNSTAAISSITIFTSGGQTYDAGTVYVYGVK